MASQTHTHYENGVHGAASLWSGSNNGASVAVPKNQQKNLISRERDSITRKMPGWRERMLPRNMQNQCLFVKFNDSSLALLLVQPEKTRGRYNLLITLPKKLSC